MSVTATVKYECNGCFAVEEIKVGPLRSRFHGVTGHEHGFGHWEDEVIDAEKHAPEGWMAFDPYTRMCYCPKCVEDIWPDPEERSGLRVVIMPSAVPDP